ncbi:MAG: hypothetical protein HDQ93_02600 [Desulfovibrio sp.]|nr:hypothetical protein [Desulfovibrio sp.]
MERASQIPAGPASFHSGSTLSHIARCMNATAGDPIAVWMAMCHDAGKLSTPSAMFPHHYNHEIRGAAIIETWATDLFLPPKFRLSGVLAASEHMKAGAFPRLRPGKKLALLEKISDSPWAAQFWRLINADTKSTLGDALRRLQGINDRAREMGATIDYRIAMIKKITADMSVPRGEKTGVQ